MCKRLCVDRKCSWLLILVLSLFSFFYVFTYALAEAIDAPGFKLRDTDQNVVSLGSYIGRKPVVLMFWTTWSPMCQSELSSLNNSYVGLNDEGIEVLAINSGELTDTVNNFIQSYYLAYPVLLDNDSSATRNYMIKGYPTYVLIDKTGKLVFSDSYFPIVNYKKLLLSNEGE